MYYLNESPNNLFEKYDPGFLKGSKDLPLCLRPVGLYF